MKTKILKTEEDYNRACERLYHLIDSSEESIEPNTPEGEEMELLSLLVEKYEQEHYPTEAPSAVEAIKFRMDQMNLSQLDIAPLFGGEIKAAEVFSGKRSLTLKMIILLNKYLGIPLESLIERHQEVELDGEDRKKLLKNSSIREYLAKHGEQ